MKKIFSLLLTVVILVGMFCFGLPTAKAAESISMNVSVTPTSLVTGGTVSLSVAVSNNGDEAVEDVTVSYDGKTLAELGNLPVGGPRLTYEEPNFSVSTSQLGKGMKIIVSYKNQAGETKQISQTVTVAKKNANVKVSGSVKTDTDVVKKGGKVNFTFAIENQGDVAIEGAELKASVLNSGNRIGDKFSLAAGKSIIINYTATVYKDLAVAPVLTFTAAGESKKYSLPKKEISVSDAGMSVSAKVSPTDAQAGDEATFTVTLKNTGNVALKNLILYDKNNNVISLSKSSLAVDESMTATTSLSVGDIGGDVTYYFTASAEDETGTTTTFRSNEVIVSVAAPSPSPSPSPTASPVAEDALTFNVTANQMSLEKAGVVTFTIEVKNNTDGEIKNITVSEKTLGKVDTISSLQGGKTATITKEVNVAESSSYQFLLAAITQDGKSLSMTGPSVAITVAEVKKSGSPALLIIIIILVILILGVGGYLFYMMQRDKKKAAEEEARKRRAGRPAMRTDTRTVPPRRDASKTRPMMTEELSVEDHDDDDDEYYEPRPRTGAAYENKRPTSSKESRNYAPPRSRGDEDRRLEPEDDYDDEPEELIEPPLKKKAPPAKKSPRQSDYEDRNFF